MGSSTWLQSAGVAAGGTAGEAGLHTGDIVVELGRARVLAATAVERSMVGDAIDRAVEITVRRNGDPWTRSPFRENSTTSGRAAVLRAA